MTSPKSHGRNTTGWYAVLSALVAVTLALGGCRSDVERYLDDLHSSKPYTRATAAAWLGETHQSSALGPLTAALRDPETRVREAAATALSKLGASGIHALVVAMGSTDSNESGAAAYGLAAAGPAAAPALLTVIRDRSYAGRSTAATLLANVGELAAIDPIVAALRDPATPDRAVLIQALASFRTSEAITGLIALIGGGGSDVAEVNSVLGSLGDAVRPVAVTGLRSKDADVRRGSVDVLDDSLDKKVVTILLTMTKDDDVVTRQRVLTTLGSSGDPRAARPLLTALTSTQDGDTARTALEGLGKAASDAVIDAYADASGSRREALLPFLAMNTTTSGLARLLRSQSAVGDFYPILLRRGDISAIPALITALDRFGGVDMATDYLNCGNPDQDKAAESWATRHGYQVIRSEGSHAGPVWGSGE